MEEEKVLITHQMRKFGKTEKMLMDLENQSFKCFVMDSLSAIVDITECPICIQMKEIRRK
jgi:hypothetical protein